MVNGPGEAASLRGQVGGQRRRQGLCIGARVVGKLDGDRFTVAVGNGVVQLLDGTFRLDAMVEAHKADALRETC